MKAIISVIGKDNVGIMYNVSKVLKDCSVSIEDVTQTILKEYFTMLMVVRLDEEKTSFSELQKELQAMAEREGLTLTVQKEEIFDAMHKI
ncbi:MAG: ACT domain-containing protein [Firmicutes bacterium]|nr:ACT domain-containing protein [Bacillota bacterium]